MSEAELHLIRARLNGGIWSKAARGQLRRALPIGFVWGEEDGQILLDPDEAVRQAIHTVFQKFAEIGSVRQVWIWMCMQKMLLPNRRYIGAELRWIAPTYHAVRMILDNIVYAGVYRYGRTRQERYIDESGQLRTRTRVLSRSQVRVVIHDHHQGYIDEETYEMNRRRIAANARPRGQQPGGALREGAALLQGLASCGRCGRKLKVIYQGQGNTPGYECRQTVVVDGAPQVCMRVGGVRIDRAVAEAFLDAIRPAGIDAALAAESEMEADREAVIGQLTLQVERALYEADRAERRYRSVEPENRLVARTLEQEWENKLAGLAQAKAELEERRRLCGRSLTDTERSLLRRLGTDLQSVWSAPTTTDRDRKELLHTLLEEVSIDCKRGACSAHLTMRWRGGAITELDVLARPARVPALRTDEQTIALLGRLAPHYPNAVIARLCGHVRRMVSATAFVFQRREVEPIDPRPRVAFYFFDTGEVLEGTASDFIGVGSRDSTASIVIAFHVFRPAKHALGAFLRAGKAFSRRTLIGRRNMSEVNAQLQLQLERVLYLEVRKQRVYGAVGPRAVQSQRNAVDLSSLERACDSFSRVHGPPQTGDTPKYGSCRSTPSLGHRVLSRRRTHGALWPAFELTPLAS
jgi:hypothetical protein